jgi:hypothetical protein
MPAAFGRPRRGAEVEWTDEQRTSRSVREYPAALDGEHAPTNPERKSKALSPSDPAAAWAMRQQLQGDARLQPQLFRRLGQRDHLNVEATPTGIFKRSMPPTRADWPITT